MSPQRPASRYRRPHDQRRRTEIWLIGNGNRSSDRVLRNDSGHSGRRAHLDETARHGILTTARRSDEIDDATLAPAIESMVTLNRAASEVALTFAVHAMTDVTGFGLLGHLREMLGGRLGAQLDGASVPLLPKRWPWRRETSCPVVRERIFQPHVTTALDSTRIFPPGSRRFMRRANVRRSADRRRTYGCGIPARRASRSRRERS